MNRRNRLVLLLVFIGAAFLPSAYGRTMAVQWDGKLLVAVTTTEWTGSGGVYTTFFKLRRYLRNGDIDTSFGTGGEVRVVGRSAIVIKPMADNKILVGGDTDRDFSVAKLNENGSLDTSFGVGGMVTTSFGSNQSKVASLWSYDDKIVAVGTAENISTGRAVWAMAKYNSNGTLDTSFGFFGIHMTGFAVDASDYRSSAVSNMFVDSYDRVFILGTHGSYLPVHAVAQYTRNGALDYTFSGDGKLLSAFAHSPLGFWQEYGGSLVVAGLTDRYPTLIKYTAWGELDTTYGVRGVNRFTTRLAAYVGGAAHVGGFFRVGTAGKYMVVWADGNDIVLSRFNTNGTPDTSFGTDGTARSYYPPLWIIGAVKDTVTNSDIYVLTQRGTEVTGNQMTIRRFRANGQVDLSFGSGGLLYTPSR